jgi:molecular chaperone GrpE
MSKKKDHAEEQAEGAARGAGAPGRAAGDAGPAQEIPVRGAAAPAEGAGPAPDRPGPAQADPSLQLAAAQAEVADLRDKLLRKQADFENFRKRMIRERDDASRYANAALLADVISTIDDFERAIRSAEESKDFPSFFQGISMIERQLLETLESRWGLKRFSSTGESFDPSRHEAVQRVEGPADSKPTVVEDFQRGYYLHERVLRPARVKVMVPAASPAGGGTGDAAAPAPSAGRGEAG